jgi:hypothetical protein
MRLLVPMAVLLLVQTAVAFGDELVAREDFDGGAINLISSDVPALDGGDGDYFGVGSRNAWPQGFPVPGVPYSIGDDSVFGYCNGTPFPGDNEGIYGEASNLDNHYFAMSDSDEFGADQTASWTFNVAGYTDLRVSIDMGGISNESYGGYNMDTDIVFTASIDGGPTQVVFDADPVAPTGYVLRPMDDGGPAGGGALLETFGDNTVTKLLAESGAPAGDTYFDKTPAAGPGAGELDAFTSDLDAEGTELVLVLVANMPYEAAVFDNIEIYGDPPVAVEPTTWGNVKGLYR